MILNEMLSDLVLSAKGGTAGRDGALDNLSSWLGKPVLIKVVGLQVTVLEVVAHAGGGRVDLLTEIEGALQAQAIPKLVSVLHVV